jgi:D-glycero-D-manno-heptose 1,7-bisphosphate phosphatase
MRIVSTARSDIARLKSAGFVVVVVTNQPDVRRGIQKRETVEAMHRVLASELALDAIETCFHDDVDACECRKPLPGLLFRAAKRLGIDLRASYMVGDRWRDVDAGRNAGCRTVLIDCGYREHSSMPDRSVSTLKEAVDWILKDAA